MPEYGTMKHGTPAEQWNTSGIPMTHHHNTGRTSRQRNHTKQRTIVKILKKT